MIEVVEPPVASPVVVGPAGVAGQGSHTRELPVDERWPDVRPTWSDLRWLVAAYAVLTVLWSLAGKAIMSSDPIVNADESVSRWFEERRTPSLDRWTLWGSDVADTMVKVVATALIVGVLIALWRRWMEPLMVAVPLVFEALTFITVTYLVGRPRPDVARLEGSPVNSSFPSGHVAAAAVYSALAVVVFWHTRRTWVRVLAVVVAAAAVVVVAYARVYRGMHYASDVVAGAVLGLVWVALCRRWLLRRQAAQVTEVATEVTEVAAEREPEPVGARA